MIDLTVQYLEYHKVPGRSDKVSGSCRSLHGGCLIARRNLIIISPARDCVVSAHACSLLEALLSVKQQSIA
jgi:hypothetical protein